MKHKYWEIIAGNLSKAGWSLGQYDTSPLMGSPPPGPFYIDFQLNDGRGIGDANNMVAIGNFQFDGGNPMGNPLPPIGGAMGDLSSSVTITDSSFLNEFTQQFNPGSDLSTNSNKIAIERNMLGRTAPF